MDTLEQALAASSQQAAYCFITRELIMRIYTQNNQYSWAEFWEHIHGPEWGCGEHHVIEYRKLRHLKKNLSRDLPYDLTKHRSKVAELLHGQEWWPYNIQ